MLKFRLEHCDEWSFKNGLSGDYSHRSFGFRNYKIETAHGVLRHRHCSRKNTTGD